MQDFGSCDTSSNLVGGMKSYHSILFLYIPYQIRMMNPIPIRLRIYLSILFIVIVAGITGMMVIEQLSPVDSLYFVVVTLATVGYGDIHPLTPLGKLFVIAIILIGVSCFVGVAADTVEFLVEQREREKRMAKLNMIIGVFYSEVGTRLLRKFSAHDPAITQIRTALTVSNNWSDDDFKTAHALLRDHAFRLDSRTLPLEELHSFLSQHKGFMLSLLANPQLYEHDRFTDLMHAVFHLAEELISRERLENLPHADYDHLSGDISRVYGQLVAEWLTYMQHLKKHYPYLFSLAMRTNPFDANASAIVQ
jgi:voltage-gated potassium channel